MSEEARTTPEAQAQAQVPPQFATEYGSLSTIYTNFCRVNVTPEELILDFGLNPTLAPNPQEPIKMTHRVVMNFFTAKRLLNALIRVVSEYENNYGVLELDIQRRLMRGVTRPAPPPPRGTGGPGGLA